MRLRIAILFLSLLTKAHAADFPRGFFVEDLRHNPPVPAFYNLESHQVQPFVFRGTYANFIDITWDRVQGRVFFSARPTAKDPYRVYLKAWPDGEEKAIYENPLGPFRFLISPNGRQLVVQVMGPLAWPILALHDWEDGHTIFLGQGFSPDWSPDGQRLLFLQIANNSLPTHLAEYRVDLATTTTLMQEPVAEAVFSDDPDRIILKTATESKACDIFQLWDQRKNSFEGWSSPGSRKRGKSCVSQREINAFPGHQFFSFKESQSATDVEDTTLVITDAAGGRMQIIAREDWDPKATAVESTTLAIGEDPLIVVSADGTGERQEVSKARFIKYQK